MPIPAPRGRAVNDAVILAVVVVSAPGGRRRRRYALRRITAGSIRTYIQPGSAADEDGVSRLKDLQADAR
jgi:hypothetical protein